MEEFIVNLCPTGMIPRRENTPHIPVSPKEIAEDVRRCRDAGAAIVHLHARDDHQEPTWEPQRFHEIISEVLAVAPDIVTCVTTSGRNWSDFEKRAAALRLPPPFKPEMASLTLGSMNFPRAASVNQPDTIKELAAEMYDLGICPELEVFEPGMANMAAELARRGIFKPPFYMNILLGSFGTSDLNAANVSAFLAALPPATVRALAGVGRHQLAANSLALSLGGHVRVGLEDNPLFDWKKREPASNPRLVERIVSIGRLMGREPATPAAAREIIGLKSTENRIV